MHSIGIEKIATERFRQVEKEGWTAEHDAAHKGGELAMAACCYAMPEQLFEKEETDVVMFRDPWPFDANWDSRRDKMWNKAIRLSGKSGKRKRVDLLVKAGALIAAEIDRLERQRKIKTEIANAH